MRASPQQPPPEPLLQQPHPRTGTSIQPHLRIRASHAMVASFRTREGGFRYRISLPYRRSLFFTPNASENASRTPGSLFEHRMRIQYRRRPSPVPNATKPERGKSLLTPNSSNCQKRRDQCKKRSPGCRREQENHSQKVCNTAPDLLNTSRKSRCRQNPLNATQKKLLSAPGIFADCYRLSPPTPRGWVAKTYLYKRRTTATRDCRSSLERKTGLGPATSTLARLRSTN